MESTLVNMLATAGVISLAAVGAPMINRFRNVPAAICALVGAALPWLVFAMLDQWPTLITPAFVGLVLVAAAFLFALFFYSAEERSATRAIALGSIAVAMGAGLYLGLLMAFPLLLARI